MFGINKNKIALLSSFFMLQILLISNSFAAFGFADPSPNDLSVSFLSKIFGGLTGGGVDAFGASIGTFNGAILTIGGILAAYTILAGTLGTAHDGEMLGKKFSSVWIPIRYALGTALVLPILSGGYCVMQAIVMWVIMQGISLGNMAWTEYVKAPPLVASISSKTKKEALDFVIQTYIANVCVQAHKKAIKDIEDKTGNILNLSAINNFGYKKDADGNYTFGNSLGPISGSTCGDISIPKKPKAPVTNSAPTGGGTSSLSGLSTLYKSIDVTRIRNAHIAQTQTVVNTTQTLAENAINNSTSVTYAQLEVIAQNYIRGIQTAATSTLANVNGSNGMAAAASQQGWFLAGSWFTKIINAQNQVNTAAGDMSTAQGRIAAPVTVLSSQVTNYMAKGHIVLAPYLQASKNLTENPDGRGNSDSAKSTNVDDGGVFAKFMAKVMTGIDLTELKDDTRHPIILMNAIGNTMINFFQGVLLAGITVFTLAGALSLGTTGGTATLISTFLIAPTVILFTTGITLAYILPNLPLLIWMGIIIGWAIMVVESIVAAPLWAVMHLHPNGDDLTGRGGNGYMLVLGLLLRPVLIIFGFIASIILSGLFGEFVNKIFFETFASSQLGGSMGFFAIIAGTAVYAIIMYTVLTKTLNLMHVIPDQLMRWIGGGGEQLGQYAGGFSGEGMAKTGAAVGAVSGYLGSGAINNAASGLTNINQAYQAKKGANAQIEANKADKIRGDAAAENSVGSDSGAVFSAISQSNGKDEQTASQEKNKFSQTSTSLGGANSPDAQNYRNAVAVQMKEPGADFASAHEGALKETLDSKFGAGSFDAAKTLSGGETNGPKFNSALNAFNKTFSSIQKTGVSDPQAAFQGVIGKAAETYGNGNNKIPTASGSMSAGFGAHMQAATNEMKNSLGVEKAGGKVESNLGQGELFPGGTAASPSGTDSIAPTASGAIGGGQKLSSGDEKA